MAHTEKIADKKKKVIEDTAYPYQAKITKSTI